MTPEQQTAVLALFAQLDERGKALALVYLATLASLKR